MPATATANASDAALARRGTAASAATQGAGASTTPLGKAHAEPAGRTWAQWALVALGASLLLAGAVAAAGASGTRHDIVRVASRVGGAPATTDVRRHAEGAARAERAREGAPKEATAAAADARPEPLDGAEALRSWRAAAQTDWGAVPPGGGTERSWAHYERVRSRCEWHVRAPRREVSSYQHYLNDHDWEVADLSRARIEGGANSSSSVREQVCDVVAPGAADSPEGEAPHVWHFTRFGPFVSTGGHDWHLAETHDLGGFGARLAAAGAGEPPVLHAGDAARAARADGRAREVPVPVLCGSEPTPYGRVRCFSSLAAALGDPRAVARVRHVGALALENKTEQALTAARLAVLGRPDVATLVASASSAAVRRRERLTEQIARLAGSRQGGAALVQMADGLRGAVAVTGVMSGAVDATSGALLGSPPVHMHHSHVYDGHIGLFAEWHADSHCTSAEGGPRCYLLLLPEGVRMSPRYALAYEAELNDIRPAGSPPLEFYVEAMVRYRWACGEGEGEAGGASPREGLVEGGHEGAHHDAALEGAPSACPSSSGGVDGAAVEPLLPEFGGGRRGGGGAGKDLVNEHPINSDNPKGEVAAKPPRAIALINSNNPKDVVGAMAPDKLRNRVAVYKLPQNYSALWFAQPMARGGAFVTTMMHTHQRALHGMLAFLATPGQLGLEAALDSSPGPPRPPLRGGGARSPPRPGVAHRFKYNREALEDGFGATRARRARDRRGDAINWRSSPYGFRVLPGGAEEADAVRARLLANLAAAADAFLSPEGGRGRPPRLLCEAHAPNASAGCEETLADGRAYARRPSLRCPGASRDFEQGETLTTVWFNKGSAFGRYQHSIFRGLYAGAPGEGVPAALCMTLENCG